MIFFVLTNFRIVGNEGFPSSFDGIVVPDNGIDVHFRDGIENYYGSEDPLLGMFISENITTAEVPFLANGVELAKLEALITFGIHMDTNRTGGTHLDVIVREFGLPLLRLQKPEQYPDYDAASQNHHTWLHEVHIPGWIQTNPLTDLYHKNVHIELDGETATFATTEK